MKIIKSILILIIMIFSLIFFVSNFSTTTKYYKCEGEILNEKSTPANLFFKLELYRFWVIWAKSDGTVTYEIPGNLVRYLNHVTKFGEQYNISNDQRNLKGNFSELSNFLGLDTSKGFFSGSCTEKTKT